MMNITATLLAALIPLLLGFVWYSPLLFANAWMKSIGVSNPEDLKGGASMPKIFGLLLLFSVMLAFALNPVVIHQMSVFSLLADIPAAHEGNAITELMLNGQPVDYMHKFRTFGHGAFHGSLFGLMVSLPFIGTGALFERRGAKYIAIHCGYWTLSSALMGGLICAWQ